MSEVSILVAVYNSEKYLRQCLDSLICQTLTDIQIVCIDDASTDGSFNILQEYSDRDSRIEVIHLLTNRGQAKARNEGLRLCNGRTITMVDSDDWLSEDALEKAIIEYDSDSSIDSVLFDLRYYYDDGMEKGYNMRSSGRHWNGNEAFVLSLDWSIHGLYITSAELYRSYPFDDSCRLYSDDNTTRLHYLHSQKVALCDGIYYYRQHELEMTKQNTLLRYELINANLSLAKTLKMENVSSEIRSIFENERWKNLVGTYCRYLNNFFSLTKEQRNNVIKNMNDIYRTIETDMLDIRLKRKFGYMYFRSFGLFMIEVRIYYFLRVILGRGFEK